MMKCISVTGLLFIFLFVVINIECILGLPLYCKTNGTVTNCFQSEEKLKTFEWFSNYPRINGLQNKYFYLNELPSDEEYQKYNNLALIYIRSCKLNEIKKHAFKELNNLQKLIMFLNKITYIDEKAFYNLGALKILYLENNRIKRIHKDAFYNLPNLEKISLRYNDIVELEEGTFSQLVKLKQLDLTGNPLFNFHENIFGENKNNFLVKDSALRFTADFMMCDYELLWIIEIFKYTKSTRNNLKRNKCWVQWKREGILDLNIDERLRNITSTSSPGVSQITNNITIIKPSINT